MKRRDSGFTLAELLIVVAIVAVLVAIAIPIFAAQLERSRESVDIANARSMYAEVLTAAISNDAAADFEGETIKKADGTFSATLTPLMQKRDGWSTNVTNMSLGSVPSAVWEGTPGADGSCTVTYDPDAAEGSRVSVAWSGGSSAPGGGDNPGGGDTPGGGDDPGSTTSTNTTTANSIANAVVGMLDGQKPGTTVTITVNPDGSSDIGVSGKNGHTPDITEDEIRTGLQDAGLLNDGSVSFDGSDTMYINGYKVTITHNNNGNNSPNTIEIEAL